MDNILLEIRAERERQDRKFGEQNHQPIEFMAILAEEIGEANKEIVDAHFGYAPKDKCLERARAEFIQVAAMAYQCVEAICRQGGHDCPFHYAQTFKDLEQEVLKACSFDSAGTGTLKLISFLAAIGRSYGEACRTSIGIKEGGNGTVYTATYCGDMYMILMMASASVHYIDTLQIQQP